MTPVRTAPMEQLIGPEAYAVNGMLVQPGAEVDDGHFVQYNGLADPDPQQLVAWTSAGLYDGIAGSETFDGVQAEGVTPMAAPAIVAGLVVAARVIAAFALRRGWTVMRSKTFLLGILKAAGIVAMWEMIEGVLGIDRNQSSVVGEDDLKGRGRRYSIGHNPRVRTLAKVSRHCQRLLKRHEKVIREFLPKKPVRYGIPPAKALSAIERAAIRGA